MDECSKKVALLGQIALEFDRTAQDVGAELRSDLQFEPGFGHEMHSSAASEVVREVVFQLELAAEY